MGDAEGEDGHGHPDSTHGAGIGGSAAR
jgi:hypothetical protein